MDKKIKFIWKFFGNDALGTAKHHTIHLEEFCNQHSYELIECNVEEIEEGFQAFLIIKEKDAIPSHPLLKPHAAFVAD